MLEVPSTADLADFSGVEEDDLTDFAAQALVQAALLLTLKTGLTEYPSEQSLADLAENAILEMAYDIYLKQPHQVTLASPFQGESIGSYSYSKKIAQQQAKDNRRTGLIWWDLAIELLATGEDTTGVASGSLQEFDPAIQVDAEGVIWILGPADATRKDIDVTYYHQDTTIG